MIEATIKGKFWEQNLNANGHPECYGVVFKYNGEKLRTKEEFDSIPKGEEFVIAGESDGGYVCTEIGTFKKI